MVTKYTSEAKLCEHFIAAAKRDGLWECYPETAGWDILMVRLVDGFQIGIQAKLKLNGAVVEQALEQTTSWNATSPGPDCRAVLVPATGGAFPESVCKYLGIVIVRLRDEESWDRATKQYVAYHRIFPDLPEIKSEENEWRSASQDRDWPEWFPHARETLPDYVPDCRAGSSSPIQLTTWKIAAIKIAIILESRPVTRADFKALRIDYGRWLPSAGRWLAKAPDQAGYLAGDRFPDFRGQHPRNYEEIRADSAKWMPAVEAAASKGQASLL